MPVECGDALHGNAIGVRLVKSYAQIYLQGQSGSRSAEIVV